MGVYTYITFVNANAPDFIAAKNGTDEQREEWEDENGNIEDRPGAPVPHDEEIINETEDEYGGWLIRVEDIPKDATHIVIYRS